MGIRVIIIQNPPNSIQCGLKLPVQFFNLKIDLYICDAQSDFQHYPKPAASGLSVSSHRPCQHTATSCSASLRRQYLIFSSLSPLPIFQFIFNKENARFPLPQLSKQHYCCHHHEAYTGRRLSLRCHSDDVWWRKSLLLEEARFKGQSDNEEPSTSLSCTVVAISP